MKSGSCPRRAVAPARSARLISWRTWARALPANGSSAGREARSRRSERACLPRKDCTSANPRCFNNRSTRGFASPAQYGITDMRTIPWRRLCSRRAPRTSGICSGSSQTGPRSTWAKGSAIKPKACVLKISAAPATRPSRRARKQRASNGFAAVATFAQARVWLKWPPRAVATNLSYASPSVADNSDDQTVSSRPTSLVPQAERRHDDTPAAESTSAGLALVRETEISHTVGNRHSRFDGRRFPADGTGPTRSSKCSQGPVPKSFTLSLPAISAALSASSSISRPGQSSPVRIIAWH